MWVKSGRAVGGDTSAIKKYNEKNESLNKVGHLSRREKTEGGEAERWREAEGGETKGRKCEEKMS